MGGAGWLVGCCYLCRPPDHVDRQRWGPLPPRGCIAPIRTAAPRSPGDIERDVALGLGDRGHVGESAADLLPPRLLPDRQLPVCPDLLLRAALHPRSDPLLLLRLLLLRLLGCAAVLIRSVGSVAVEPDDLLDGAFGHRLLLRERRRRRRRLKRRRRMSRLMRRGWRRGRRCRCGGVCFREERQQGLSSRCVCARSPELRVQGLLHSPPHLLQPVEGQRLLLLEDCLAGEAVYDVTTQQPPPPPPPACMHAGDNNTRSVDVVSHQADQTHQLKGERAPRTSLLS